MRSATRSTWRASAVTFALEPGPGLSRGTVDAPQRIRAGRIGASFSGTQAGESARVLAMVSGHSVPNGHTVTVLPEVASALHSSLEVSAITLQPGGSSAVTLRVRDATGTSVSAGGLTVTFAVEEGDGLSRGSLGPAEDLGDGRYLTTFTAEAIGAPVAVYAAVEGVPVGGVPPTIQVVEPPVSPQRAVLTVSHDTLQAGATAELRLQMKDSDGKDLARAGLAVEFSVGGPSNGDIGPIVDHGDGSYTSSFLGKTAGGVSTVAFSVDSIPFERAEATIVVLPGALEMDSSHVLINGRSADSVLIGDTAVVQANLTDAFGNVLPSGGEDVSFSIARPALGEIGPVADNGDGSYSAQFVAKAPGPLSALTATAVGHGGATRPAQVAVVDRAYGVSADSSFITVAGGDSITIEAGVSVTIELQAVDSIGRALLLGGHGVTFAVEVGDSLSTGVLSSVTDRMDGTYSADFIAVGKGRALAVAGFLGADSVTSPLPTIRVTPGDISAMTSTVLLADSVIAVGDSTLATLVSIDAYGNTLETGGLPVTFEIVAGDSLSTASVGATMDHGDGRYSAVLTGTAPGAPTRVRAWIGGTKVVERDAGIRVTSGSSP